MRCLDTYLEELEINSRFIRQISESLLLNFYVSYSRFCDELRR